MCVCVCMVSRCPPVPVPIDFSQFFWAPRPQTQTFRLDLLADCMELATYKPDPSVPPLRALGLVAAEMEPIEVRERATYQEEAAAGGRP